MTNEKDKTEDERRSLEFKRTIYIIILTLEN